MNHDAAPVLSVRGLRKSYGSHQVLKDVSLDVRPGEVTALLGENGAGKSTLAKIIAGVQPHDGGELLVGGLPQTFHSPREAMAAGVSVIPQELTYVPELTVAENICLGRVPGRSGTTSQRAIVAMARAEARAVGFELPLTARMASVPLMQQQLAIILRALAGRPRVIVLDEPTAALEVRDSAVLLSLVHRLAEQGVALVYISHRLEEVFAHCDTVHVLREGSLVLSGQAAELKRADVVHAMIDKDIDDIVLVRPPVDRTVPVLTASGWAKSSHPQLDDVGLELAVGEVVGLYGLRGSGSDTLVESFAGMHGDASGRLEIAGRPVTLKSPHHAKRAGLLHVPADRKSQGLVMGATTTENLTLPALSRVSRLGWLRSRLIRKRSQDLAARTTVRARSLHGDVAQLSGGNQQKVLLGSRLNLGARVLALQEPSRGVDVNARLEIHRLLRALAAEGVGQLVASSDVEELVIVCDRILVFRGGRIVHEVTNPTLASQAELIEHAGGLQE